MKKLKILAVALGAVAITSSALATPTLVIWDTGGSSATVLAAPTGLASFASVSFDGAWSVVITTSETKPALGSATAPAMDLNVQATSLGLASRDLHVSWSDDAFGPFNSSLVAKLTGHVVSGTGAGVQYQTFYQAGFQHVRLGRSKRQRLQGRQAARRAKHPALCALTQVQGAADCGLQNQVHPRSEEHTSELQSLRHL